jgi:hypothetical protein
MPGIPGVIVVAALVVAAAVPVGLDVSFQQGAVASPLRDVRGTSRVSGVVAGPDGVPLEGVTLTLMSSAWQKATVGSDRGGRFAFTALPAELYYLRAEKAGFLETYYGALRPGGDGTPIALATGQRVDGLTITMHRLGAITGTVRRRDLTAAAGITVQVTPKDGRGIAGVGHTDDRGLYRISDLHAGEYKVQAMPASEAAGIPVFHPGTTSPGQGATVRVELGEERDRIDISLVDEQPISLTGVLLDLAGLPAPDIQVFAIPVGWGGGRGRLAPVTGPNGEFTFESIFPGRYALRAYLPLAPDAPPSDPATLWAAETVDVPLAAATSLTLRLQPPLVFSGRVRFVGQTRPPSDLTTVRIDLQQDGWKPTPVDVRADGTFARSVLPGSYDIGAFVSGAPLRWQLRSAVKDGRDLLDALVEFNLANGGLTDVELTFSDQQTTLSGIVTTGSGAPLPACYVVVFPADRGLWATGSLQSIYERRVTQRRPATDGRFVFEGLPPGDYLLAAVSNLDPAGWRTAGFLESLVERAGRVTLREGDRKTQDLRVTGR